MKALVVEDSPDVALMLELFLQTEGCEVDRADTGAGALEAYWRAVGSGEGHGLIFLDFALPGPDGMDGLSVARRIRAAESERNSSPAFICGYTAHADALLSPGAIKRAGLDMFLIKAASEDEMVALRDAVIRARAQRS